MPATRIPRTRAALCLLLFVCMCQAQSPSATAPAAALSKLQQPRLLTPPYAPGRVAHMSFLSDGRTLATQDAMMINLWDLEQGLVVTGAGSPMAARRTPRSIASSSPAAAPRGCRHRRDHYIQFFKSVEAAQPPGVFPPVASTDGPISTAFQSPKSATRWWLISESSE